MAYRLAEVREAVEHATDPTACKAAQAEQDSLIIALWAQRPFLSVAIGPDRQLGPAITLIEAALGKQHQWHHPSAPTHDPPAVIEAIRDATQGIATATATLLYKRERLASGPDDPDLPLSKNERVLRERLDELASVLVLPASARLGRGREAQPSDEEVVALLEQSVNGQIEALTGLLNTLRQAVIRRKSSPKDGVTSKRKVGPRKPQERRKQTKPKTA